MEVEQTQRYPGLVWAWYGVAVIIAATIAQAMDQQVMVLLTDPIKHGLGLDDTQIGLLNGFAASFFAAVATVPMGWLADRMDRRLLLFACVLLWSIAAVARGLTHNFQQLFLCSAGLAVASAVLGPISYTLIPDLFPRERWIVANYVLFLAAIVGSALGLSGSGALIGTIDAYHAALPEMLAVFSTWRLALMAVGVPGAVLAFLILLVRSRKRVGGKGEEHGAEGLVGYFRTHARTLSGVFVGFGLAACAAGTVQVWLPVALIRVFKQTPGGVGIAMGLLFTVSSVAGVLASSYLVRALRPRFKEFTPMRVAQAGVIISALMVPLMLLAPSIKVAYAIVFVQSLATTAALSLSPTMLQFIAPSSIRGRVIAIGGLVYVIFVSLSPLAVGWTSDHIVSGLRGLLWAIAIVSLPCYALGAIVLEVANHTLPGTMKAAEG